MCLAAPQVPAAESSLRRRITDPWVRGTVSRTLLRHFVAARSVRASRAHEQARPEGTGFASRGRTVTMRSLVMRVLGVSLLVLTCGLECRAQAPAPAPPPAEASVDALGRSTPRGTVRGFLAAGRQG